MDRKEFETVAPTLRERIVSLVGRMMAAGSDPEMAEDVAQDTLLRLWARRDSLESYRSIEALAMVMARNRAVDMLRSQQAGRHTSLDGYDSPDSGPDPHESLEADEAESRMRDILDSLPSAQQALIRMRHAEGMEIDEIAAVTGSTPGSIRTALSRARRHIKDLFLQQNNI